MINIIDIVAILILILCAFLAYKRGFVKTFFGFISTFLAIILAFVFCNVGVELIKNNTEIDEWIEMTLTNAIDSKKDNTEKLSSNGNDTISGDEEIEDEKGSILSALEDLPQNLQDVVGIEEYKANTKKMLVQKAVPIILKVLSWVIIYFLARLILWVLCIVFDGIMNIPFLKQINNLAGLALGIILGIFRIYVILAFISFLVSVVPIQPLVTSIKSSLIVSVMYENNLLINLIF